MSRRTPPPTPAARPGMMPRYRDRIWDDKRHDPYEPAGKYASPARCGECGAVYLKGRWTWAAAPVGAESTLCPACRRVRERAPAGIVVIEGALAATLRDELLRIARNEAEHERTEHPMHRILHVDERDGRVEISTTDIHLPQRIGNALKHAHRGHLDVSYAEDEYAVRVRWRA